MRDSDVVAAKEKLDGLLAPASPNAGIGFGYDLYVEFAKRGWFTLETYTVSGTGAYPVKLPTYDRTHPAAMLWDLPLEGFKVGP